MSDSSTMGAHLDPDIASLGASELALAERLERLDLGALQPGARERWWEEFCVRAAFPPPASPGHATGEAPPVPARSPADLIGSRSDAKRPLGFSRVPILPRAMPRNA